MTGIACTEHQRFENNCLQCVIEHAWLISIAGDADHQKFQSCGICDERSRPMTADEQEISDELGEILG